MKFTLVTGAILLGLSTATLAGPCQDDVVAIDKALGTQDLASDLKAQAQDMRNQADQLCKAGNEDEGLALTAEAKVLLHLD